MFFTFEVSEERAYKTKWNTAQIPPSRCAYLFVTPVVLYIINNHQFIIQKNRGYYANMKTPDTQAVMETILVFTVFLCMYWFLGVPCVSDLEDDVWRSISHFVDGAVFYLYRSHLQWVFQPGPQHFLLRMARPAQCRILQLDVRHTHTHTYLSIISPKTLRVLKVSVCLCV